MRGSEFAELKAFVAVVERASFARAADDLRISRSALSQVIRQLESRIGVRLLNRTTRSVAPTEAGRRLHERIAPMLREVDDAVAQAVRTKTRTAGTLRINTLSMAAKKIIAPRLAGIRVGERLQKDMVAVRLTPDVRLLAVASPEYLARYGEPRTPTDLHSHACLNWRFPGSGKIARWEFLEKGKRIETLVEGPLVSNHQDIVVPAALQGLGILYAYNDDGIAEALERGRLKRVLIEWVATMPGLYLYYSNRQHIQPALRAFIDCLLDRDAGMRPNPT
jgi:DNA-binding transcriptional LysR family regulator